MTITYDSASRVFHLKSKQCSYILQVVQDGYLAHRYFGPVIQSETLVQPMVLGDRAFSPNPNPEQRGFSPDLMAQEYPGYGRSDYRIPAFEIRFADGSSVADLRYAGHRIVQGKPALPGLPATYVEEASEADTLFVDLVDSLTGLKVVLSYTAFCEHSVIARSAQFINEGGAPVSILRAMSASIDLDDDDYDMTQLSGAWARERDTITRKLTSGTQTVESRRGASSHQQNPFVALSRPNTTETHGEVIGLSLVYSGNFVAGAEVDQFNTTRLFAGINPFDFSWKLDPGESFQAPEAVLAFSNAGFGDLSRTYHRLYRTRLARGKFRDAVRPILINNWEATYFNFNQEILVELGKLAGELGIELFVLDDGWFGHRNDDHTSLGDWVIDASKLPNGLTGVAEPLQASGLKFGLWFEPEMVSPDSDLYRAHPDWCLHVENRSRSEGRNQLILDYSRSDVRQAVLTMLRNILQSAPIRYVKWDMNRHMTEIGSAKLDASRQRETAHRYMLGLYEMLETITAEFPDILFESCSGGGGRFDPGMLYYMPQVWTSDNTDAIARLPIQFGTSLVYPSSAMGAHVSAVPNHQVERFTPLTTRGIVAMMGNYGYELDLGKLSQEDLAIVRAQVSFYKEVRQVVQFGDLYRLVNPDGSGRAAWMYVNENQTEALVSYVKVLQIPNSPSYRVRLQGLNPGLSYRVRRGDGTGFVPTSQNADGTHGDELRTGAGREAQEWVITGEELMHHGLTVPQLHGDFSACQWHLKAISH